MRSTPSRLVLSLSLALGAVGAQAITFHLADTGNANANAGFATAAAMWAAQYSDPIDIYINSGYTTSGFSSANIIGQASSAKVAISYSNFRTALAADAIYPQNGTDPLVLASLPVASSVAWRRTNVATGAIITDNDGSGNNTTLAVNRANAKAVGLIAANDATVDATITFNAAFAFDFDRSNGIASNQIDFVGVAFHEIGHALGFVSGVDTYDFYRSADPSASRETSLNNSAVFSPLDLLRYTSAGVRDTTVGNAPYFSINGGTSNQGLFSTGAYNGDGSQASHWKDNLGIGAMDPTAGFGELVTFTVNDGRALDAIGYDVVPEPATLAALGLGAAALLRRRRKSA